MHPRQRPPLLFDGPPDLSGRVIAIDLEGRGYCDEGRFAMCEVAAIELINGRRTGRVFCTHLDPMSSVSYHAHAVHGLTQEFLAGKPTFAATAPDLIAFLGDAALVAHGAGSDRALLDHDLAAAGLSPVAPGRFVCTELIALRLFGVSLGLDALCDRLGVDRSARGALHGARVDAELAADCLLALARHPGFADVRGVRPIQTDKLKRNGQVECMIEGATVRFTITNRETGEIREIAAPLPSLPDTHEATAGRDGYLRVTRKGSRAPDNSDGAALMTVLGGEVASFAFENGCKVRI